MIINSVYDYLCERKICTEEVDIFQHTLPIKIDLAVLLIYTSDGVRINHEIKDYFQDSFAVVVRGKSFTKVREKTDLIVNELDLVNRDLGNIHFNFLKPATLPYYYPKDSSANYEANVVMDFSCYVKPEL